MLQYSSMRLLLYRPYARHLQSGWSLLARSFQALPAHLRVSQLVGYGKFIRFREVISTTPSFCFMAVGSGALLALDICDPKHNLLLGLADIALIRSLTGELMTGRKRILIMQRRSVDEYQLLDTEPRQPLHMRVVYERSETYQTIEALPVYIAGIFEERLINPLLFQLRMS